LLRAAGRVVEDASLVDGIILCQGQDIGEVEYRRGPWTLKVFHVIAVPAFVTEFQRVCPLHVREHVTPVVVVLDEIALREVHAVGHSSAIHVDVSHDIGNGVILRAGAQVALYAAHTERCIVQGSGREGVRPRALYSDLPGWAEARKLRSRS